jgi:hypothetical protein
MWLLVWVMTMGMQSLLAGEPARREGGEVGANPNIRRAVEDEHDEEGDEEDEGDEAMERFERLMEKRVTVEHVGTPFKDLLKTLHKAGLNIVVHQATLKEKGEMPVTLALTQVPMRLAIEMLARSLDLKVSWDEGAIYLGPKTTAEAMTLTKRIPGGELKVTFTDDEVPAGVKRGLMGNLFEEMERAGEQEEDRRHQWRERMEQWRQRMQGQGREGGMQDRGRQRGGQRGGHNRGGGEAEVF